MSTTTDTERLCVTTEVSGLLAGLRDYLADLPDAVYCSSPSDHSPVGSHLRHALDHVAALLTGISGGCIQYDRRVRGTAIEQNRQLAVARLDDLISQIQAIPAASLADEIQVELVIDPRLPAAYYASTVGREFAFVLSHTIHHNALIAMLAQEHGCAMPASLMSAPATLQFHNNS